MPIRIFAISFSLKTSVLFFFWTVSNFLGPCIRTAILYQACSPFSQSHIKKGDLRAAAQSPRLMGVTMQKISEVPKVQIFLQGLLGLRPWAATTEAPALFSAAFCPLHWSRFITSAGGRSVPMLFLTAGSALNSQ